MRGELPIISVSGRSSMAAASSSSAPSSDFSARLMVSIICAISNGLARYSNAPPSVAAITVSMLPAAGHQDHRAIRILLARGAQHVDAGAFIQINIGNHDRVGLRFADGSSASRVEATASTA